MDQAAAAKTYARALRLLALGRFEEAWPLYEARRWIAQTQNVEPGADYPEWRGQDLAGKRIMVVAEQGFGDQLMFGRYLSALSALGGEVVLLCHPTIWMLFGEIGYGGRPFLLNQPAPPADYWVFIGSLPLRLGIPSPPAPVYFPMAGFGGGVGVKTAGSPTNFNDRARSLAGRDAEDLLALGRDLDPSATGARSFLQTARIVAGLDLVVTVDTSVGHLAGAMGKACWVLLPWRNLDWRWGDGACSPWYPAMRLFRQGADEDWRPVLNRVRSALAEVQNDDDYAASAASA